MQKAAVLIRRAVTSISAAYMVPFRKLNLLPIDVRSMGKGFVTVVGSTFA
jgi:hypothetical protein